MAADSETKRRSALGHTLQSLVVAPFPDNAVGAVDRMHILGYYAGISPGIYVPTALGFMWRRTFNLAYRSRYRYGTYSVRGSR